MKRVLVCGGRDYGRIVPGKVKDFPKRKAEGKKAREVLDALFERIGPFVLIHGGAKGADLIAGKWAFDKAGMPNPEEYRAAWNDLSHPDAFVKMHTAGPNRGIPYDARAGIRRNQRMIDEGKPDLVVAFPGGTGTADMIDRAERAGIPVERVK